METMSRMIRGQACLFLMLAFMSMNAGPTDGEAQNLAQIQEILRQDRGGMFRGVHFQMLKEEVIAEESTVRCLKMEGDQLIFAIKESSAATFESTKLYYGFKNNSLSDVMVKSIEKDHRSAMQLFRELKYHYEKIYGESQSSQKAMAIWHCNDGISDIVFDIVCELNDNNVVIKYRSI